MAKDTPETLAQKIRDVVKERADMTWLNVISDHVDNFDMRHSPPTPLDGMTSGAEVRRLNDFEIANFPKVVAGGYKVSGPVTVEGDDVITELTLQGALKDGTPVKITSRTNWTTKDGRIVSCIARSVPEKSENGDKLMTAFQAVAPFPSAESLGFSKRA